MMIAKKAFSRFRLTINGNAQIAKIANIKYFFEHLSTKNTSGQRRLKTINDNVKK